MLDSNSGLCVKVTRERLVELRREHSTIVKLAAAIGISKSVLTLRFMDTYAVGSASNWLAAPSQSISAAQPQGGRWRWSFSIDGISTLSGLTTSCKCLDNELTGTDRPIGYMSSPWAKHVRTLPSPHLTPKSATPPLRLRLGLLSRQRGVATQCVRQWTSSARCGEHR
jgi:hypothetical protein